MSEQRTAGSIPIENKVPKRGAVPVAVSFGN